MIELGCIDADVSDAAYKTYTTGVEQLTRRPLAEIVTGIDKIVAKRMPTNPPATMNVAQLQQALKEIGFFPGATIDGICGYRTQSAIRLFQEYVRSAEKLDCTPDGQFGPKSQAHLQRWLDGKLRTVWAPTIEAWKSGTLAAGEFTDWLALLETVKQHALATPTRVQTMVNAFTGKSDTRKVAQWDFSASNNIHLVGIRRNEMQGKFDDIFVLLIKGLVFKFQGTTEPGASENPAGPPFLVPGQHDYHFGWHQSKYLALRPQSSGVLVVRAGNDKRVDDADLAKGLEANATINIHWGGRGMTRDVNSWSEGCQTINGTVYINASDALVSCAAFTASTPNEAMTDVHKTRGAYNVLLDLVSALGSDIPGGTVKYTLLTEADLALAPALAQRLSDARTRVMQMPGA